MLACVRLFYFVLFATEVSVCFLSFLLDVVVTLLLYPTSLYSLYILCTSFPVFGALADSRTARFVWHLPTGFIVVIVSFNLLRSHLKTDRFLCSR